MRESPEFEVIAGAPHPQLPQIRTTFFSCLSSYGSGACMFKRIWAIIQKEFIQIVRDRVTLAIICTMPMLQLLLFAYAIHMDVKHIRLVVADQSLDQASRTYLDAMVNSGYFDIVSTVSAPSDVIPVSYTNLRAHETR